ncbi:unnamed protein product [Larinioides sclopetarius]|uniref:C2H2-type domain-containing protein n=1 Tax=Larinioides sclopetarius TaxID=280406 RepID=A0AAV2BYK7_9ARAC
MGRYLCHRCNTIVNYGEDDHPCFSYNNDHAVYTIPQQEYASEMSTSKKHAENSIEDRNICETAEQTRNTSPALTSAHSAFSIENKDNMLSRDVADRPSSPVTPFNAPTRKGEMDANEKQPLELKKDAGAEAGPSAVHPHSLRPGGKKKYVCNVCRKQFKKKSRLVNHYRIHTGEKPFVCGSCGKEFADKANLNRHGRTHTGEKPFACDTCGRDFRQKIDLERHLRIHTGEKPFICDTCGKEFTQKGNLTQHVRTHTSERPYVCDICGKSFAEERYLKKHVVTHNGGGRYTCSVCGETFGSNEDRNRHFQQKHQ